MAELLQKVEAEMENIEKILGKIPDAKALPDLSELEMAGVAALVHSFYNGVENIVQQILRDRQISLPSGPSWHKELVELACNRDVISERTRSGIAEFLAFRHFFAHAYAFDMDPSRLMPLVAEMGSVYGRFKADCKNAINSRA